MSAKQHLPKFVIAQRTVSYQVSELLSDMSDDELSNVTLDELLRIVDSSASLDFGDIGYVTYTDENGIDLIARRDLDAPHPTTTP